MLFLLKHNTNVNFKLEFRENYLVQCFKVNDEIMLSDHSRKVFRVLILNSSVIEVTNVWIGHHNIILLLKLVMSFVEVRKL